MTPLFFILGVCFALINRIFHTLSTSQPRLVWGATPIISYSYWARAMAECGYTSQTFTNSYYATINRREDWDLLIQERYGKHVPLTVKFLLAFFESLFKYDVFFISFNGFFLGLTPYWWMESFLLKLAGKKTVVLPYGFDSYVYRRIRSLDLVHALLLSYPGASKQQKHLGKVVDHWCDHADIVIPGIMGPDGFGRWDVLLPSFIHIDLRKWQSTQRSSFFNGFNGTVFIAHAPNHRGCKGTEFVIEAVEFLKEEGLKVELILIERKQNEEVREIFKNQVDILIEQLLGTGHALNAIEGLASGLPVISNLEDDSLLRPFRRWSYFSECPIVSASPETITDVLRKLVTRPELRHQLGRAGREYAEKYHGLDSAQYMFGAVIDYLYGRMDAHALLNLYNPRTSEYCRRRPKVEHPLVNNRIMD
jgi:glycosyltransferase involved in cell wall biosynthesis